MNVKNYLLILILFVTIIACNTGGTNADSIEAVEATEQATDQHKAVVKEILQTPVYSYLFVEEHNKSYWVACTRQEFFVDQTVYFMTGLAMENFNSKELNRTFDLVYFLNEVTFEKGEEHMHTHAAPKGMVKEAVKAEIKVDRAEGGITLEDLYSNPQNYKGKIVKIKGQVVKYNEAIMGKNWVHIQDGTGSGNDFDLTITTQNSVNVGDVVTFSGTIFLDKDFGAGYIYKVIMEDSELLTEL